MLDLPRGAGRAGPPRGRVLDRAATRRAVGAQEFRAAGIAIESVPKGRWTDPTLPLRLALRMRHHGVAVVHTHNPFAMTYGAPAGKLARTKVVHTNYGRNGGSWSRRKLRRAIARPADAYVAVSSITADQARRGRDVDERKLRVIPDGIDPCRLGRPKSQYPQT